MGIREDVGKSFKVIIEIKWMQLKLLLQYQ